MTLGGAILEPVRYPLAAVETHGAILFADLPGYSRLSVEMGPVATAYVANHFFAWFEGEARRRFHGIVERFIGDALLVVFLFDECEGAPLTSALLTAKAMLDLDPYGFSPKIGIAAGPFAVSLMGVEGTADVSVVGHTVNLASRCVTSLDGGPAIRVASDDLPAIEAHFEEVKWDVMPPASHQFHNMDRLDVIDIRARSTWIANFDYRSQVRKDVELARESGAVRSASDCDSLSK